jgi:hypothetical protein
MNKVILGAVGVFILLTSATSHAWETPQEEAALLESDATESRKIQSECEQALAMSNDLVKSHLEKSQLLQSKKDYSLVLESFKKFPRTSESAWRGLKPIIAMPELYQDLNLDLIYKAYGCNPMALFDAGKLLITSAKALGLNKEERVDLAHTILDRVSYDMTSGRPNLLNFLTDFNLLTLLMDGGLVDVSDPIYIELMHLDQDSIRLKRELQRSYGVPKTSTGKTVIFSKLSKEDQKRDRSTLFKELEGVDALHGRLVWLMKRIRIVAD